MKSSVLILSAVIFGLVKCEKSAVDILVAEYLGLDPPEADRNNFEANAKLAAEMTRSKSISLKVARGGPEYPSHYKLNVSSICLFDSVDNFVENFKSINWLTNKRFRHPHLVYIPGATLSDILSSIHDGFSIDHVGFLVDGVDGSIELVTNFMYTSHACRANQLMTVNRFSGVEGKWETSIFYPNKYNDFHGCTLTVASYCDVLTELQSSLNFKSEVKYRETLEDAIKDEQIDLLGGSLQYKGDKIFIASAAFATENIIYVGPPGEPYSQFEKMFLPFDEGAWIAICCTFLFLLVAIQVVGFCSMTVQNFVYGRNIRTPTMNLFDIFLNGGQRKVPGRNFSRFMLTLFLVWSLIIRTCYQSKLFEFLQADMRKPGPRTLQDLGYVLVGNKLTPINPGDNMMYTPTKFDEPTRKSFAFCFRGFGPFERLDIVSDPTNKAFTAISQDFVILAINRLYHSGNPSFAILDDWDRTYFHSVPFKLFCPLFETFNQKIGTYLSAGLDINIKASIKHQARGVYMTEEEIGPQVLTVDDLLVGFQIHVVLLGISSIVFVIELLIGWAQMFLTVSILHVHLRYRFIS